MAATWAAAMLGFALGGFLDGILLHQLLQWHHLLSGLRPEATLEDLRFHTLWDGAFHAAHYLVLAAGLALLWRGRGPAPLAWAAIGFGAWHLLDAAVNHWALGLHRIRQDSPQPLLWDLVFFALGLAAVAVGLAHRRARLAVPRGVASLVLLLAAGGAALPARGPVLVAFALPAERAVPLALLAEARLVAFAEDVAVVAAPDAARLRAAALALGARPVALPHWPGMCLTPG